MRKEWAACIVVAAFAPGCGWAVERDVTDPPARACLRYGPGFVQMPGSTTCIRIAGRVRSEYGTGRRTFYRRDRAGFATSGTVSVDTRTDTAYGPLRTLVRMRAGQATGPHP